MLQLAKEQARLKRLEEQMAQANKDSQASIKDDQAQNEDRTPHVQPAVTAVAAFEQNLQEFDEEGSSFEATNEDEGAKKLSARLSNNSKASNNNL